MTEEEKETIERQIRIMKRWLNEHSIIKDRSYARLSYYDTEKITNMLEKQQKEIDELRQSYDKATTKTEELKKKLGLKQFDVNVVYNDYLEKIRELKINSIPKYKVIEFIKRLEKDAQNIREKKKDSHDYDRSSSRIQAYLTKTNEIIKRLKELLEED